MGRRMSVAGILGGVALFVLLALAWAGAARAQTAQAKSISVIDFAFEPTTITVAVGDTVMWKNNGQRPHTATASDGSFDSGNLNAGQEFSHTFAAAGSFAYICTYHPNMQATITVEAAAPAAQPQPAAPAAQPAAPTAPDSVTVQTADKGALGMILTDDAGRTLYRFTRDAQNQSNCYDQCAVRWPPLLIGPGQPGAGAGAAQERLGVIQRTDGTNQVTYDGMPLYYFANDANPGDTTGQGVGEVWFVVNTAAPAEAAPAPQAAQPAQLPRTAGDEMPSAVLMAGLALLAAGASTVARLRRNRS